MSYQVDLAFWFPTYDVRVKTDPSNKLFIIYYGNIKQHCGEDWKDVELIFSTETPSTGSTLPQLVNFLRF